MSLNSSTITWNGSLVSTLYSGRKEFHLLSYLQNVRDILTCYNLTFNLLDLYRIHRAFHDIRYVSGVSVCCSLFAMKTKAAYFNFCSNTHLDRSVDGAEHSQCENCVSTYRDRNAGEYERLMFKHKAYSSISRIWYDKRSYRYMIGNRYL